jgi:hypothetical protein
VWDDVGGPPAEAVSNVAARGGGSLAMSRAAAELNSVRGKSLRAGRRGAQPRINSTGQTARPLPTPWPLAQLSVMSFEGVGLTRSGFHQLGGCAALLNCSAWDGSVSD